MCPWSVGAHGAPRTVKSARGATDSPWAAGRNGTYLRCQISVEIEPRVLRIDLLGRLVPAPRSMVSDSRAMSCQGTPVARYENQTLVAAGSARRLPLHMIRKSGPDHLPAALVDLRAAEPVDEVLHRVQETAPGFFTGQPEGWRDLPRRWWGPSF
jgi:hypothetical protein